MGGEAKKGLAWGGPASVVRTSAGRVAWEEDGRREGQDRGSRDGREARSGSFQDTHPEKRKHNLRK